VRVTAAGEGREQAERLAQQAVDEVRRRLGSYVFGLDDDTLAGAVGRLLRQRQATLSVAESCTGGLLGQLITEVSGASDYFLGGAICYADAVKQRLLGVPAGVLAEHGAASEPVAQAMAQGAMEIFGATYALAVTGIAGPAGGTEAKPVGLVYIALGGPDGVQVESNRFSGDRENIRLRSALWALNMLRLELNGGE
jgi:nicotinamide-nucleotide amidase